MSFSTTVKNEILLLEDNNYLRKQFLLNGSITNPQKGYHVEFASDEEALAIQIFKKLQKKGLNAKIVKRGRYYITYLKEGEHVADFLNIIGAHSALMDFENIRILKDIGNKVNRQLNCEMANLGKIIKAAVKQEEDINLIISKEGISSLPLDLKVVAQARLDNMHTSIQGLADILKLSKSCVNHRLRRISKIAEKINEKECILKDCEKGQ